MICYIPDITLVNPLETTSIDRLGGVPVGFASRKWPVCEGCSEPMIFLAQFAHHPQRLDLGAAGRVLFIFKCGTDGDCEAWRLHAKNCFALVVEQEDLTTKRTRPPESTKLELSCEIQEWVEYDDKVSPAMLTALMQKTGHVELEDKDLGAIVRVTKLGGAPYWVNVTHSAPTEDWKFVGSIDHQLSFLRDPSLTSQPVVRDAGIELFEDKKSPLVRNWYTEGPFLGESGLVHIFLRPDGTMVPHCRLVW